MSIRDLAPQWTRRDPDRKSGGDHPIAQLQREMDRVFEDFFHDFELPGIWHGRRDGKIVPHVDVSDTDSEITVEAELPGMSDKDIEINLTDDALTITGEKKEESEKKEKDYIRTERSFGRIERTIPLHAEIQQSKVTARFDNGVLSVKLPKAPSAQKKVKKIAVTPGKGR